ncbi:MAG: MOSC N-terminal beta barrel domain-containing protein [Mycobacterium sp.]
MATVTQLWRFPVKSMGGQQVSELFVTARGGHADRLWAVRDLQNNVTASARRIPALLGCTARYQAEPGPDAGPGNVPAVSITFPGGDEVSSNDPAIHTRLSDLAGRDVRLTPLAPVSDTSQHRLSVRQSKATFSQTEVRRDFGLDDSEALPDSSVFSTKQILTLARFSTPPGTFVDLSPIHLMSSASLAALSPDGAGYDVRRFRPNVLLDADDSGAEFPEAAWVGATVEIGTARLWVSVPTVRCVVPTRPQPGIELDRAITRQLAERTNRFLGVYADVTGAGVLHVGDDVRIQLPVSPGVARGAAAAVAKAVVRGVQRVLEKTVLREG